MLTSSVPTSRAPSLTTLSPADPASPGAAPAAACTTAPAAPAAPPPAPPADPEDELPRAWRARRWAWLPCVVSPVAATALFWTVFGACVAEVPAEPLAPAARLVASWDPQACGEPHRVALELEDDDGVELAVSAPCWAGGVAVDVPRWGVYRARAFAWRPGEVAREDAPAHALTIDAPVVRWWLTPPP